MKYKTIIVDDERLARRELRRRLAEFDEIAVAGEAENLAEAIELIEAEKPHVVFLDIDLAGENGFELLEKTASGFKVIFVTAYDEYAIRAFDVNALDYLSKPVDAERLGKAIARLQDASDQKTESPPDAPPLEFDDRIFLEVGERAVLLKICDISHVGAAGGYSELMSVAGKKMLVEKPLSEWERRLPEKYFLRIHRQTIINLEQIEEISAWFNGTFQVRLKNQSPSFTVSRRRATKLRSRYF